MFYAPSKKLQNIKLDYPTQNYSFFHFFQISVNDCIYCILISIFSRFIYFFVNFFLCLTGRVYNKNVYATFTYYKNKKTNAGNCADSFNNIFLLLNSFYQKVYLICSVSPPTFFLSLSLSLFLPGWLKTVGILDFISRIIKFLLIGGKINSLN